MLKLANPLYYPVAVLIGGIVLVVGVRFLRLPNFAILPTSFALATLSAAVLKARETEAKGMATKLLEQELKEIKSFSQDLAKKAEVLRAEAAQLLAQPDFQLNLLVAIEEACDRAIELPERIENLARSIVKNESLLSTEELQQKLREVHSKIPASSGASRQQLEKLAASLERNIQLARAGTDTRQAQIVNLHTILQDAAGVLQELQNKIRSADLTDSEKIQELTSLTEALKTQQKQVDIYLDK